MDKLLEQALEQSDTPADFLMEQAAKVHAAHGADFDRVSQVPLCVSVYLTDVDARYTMLLGQGGRFEVTDDEMDDFPQVTVEGRAADWGVVKAQLIRLGGVLSGRRGELERKVKTKVTQRVQDDFGKIDGVIDIEIADAAQKVELRVILNHYEAQSDVPRFKIKLPLAVLDDIVSGRQEAAAAIKAAAITGDTKFAFNLVGFFSNLFG